MSSFGRKLVRIVLYPALAITGAVLLFAVVERHRLSPVFRILASIAQVHDADGVLAYMVEHPGSVSLATWEVGHEEQAVLLHADEPRSLASTVKALVLAAYAQQVESGLLDPDSRVSLTDWDAFYLPRTDGGAHPKALADLKKKDRIVDGSVTLGDVAHAMIVHSDNAAADLVMMKVGRSALARAPEAFATRNDEAPFPLSGGMLLATSAPEGQLPNAWIAQLEAEGRMAIADRAWAIAERLATDEPYRKRERARCEASGIGLTLPDRGVFAKALVPRGTARGYARLMARVTTAPASSRWSQVMSSNLEWALGRGGALDRRFDRYGTKGGSLAGVLTSATYAAPRGRPTRVLTLFFEDLPLPLWMNLTKSFTRQQFEARILEDPAFLGRLALHLTRGQ